MAKTQGTQAKRNYNHLTGEQALERWCPFARAFDTADNGSVTATNRPLAYAAQYGGKRRNINCIADDCMAWRWVSGSELDADVGYCGLAGRPS